MWWRTKVRGTVFKNTKNELLKEIQRFVFEYQQSNLKEVFLEGKIAFSLKDHHIRILYKNEKKQVDMEITIPLINGGRRTLEELKFLCQDFILNAYYSYERMPEDMDKMKLIKLSAILGVNYRTAWKEIGEIEKQLLSKTGKFFDIAEQLIEKQVITKRNDIPWTAQMIDQLSSS